MIANPNLTAYDAVALNWRSSDVDWVARGGPERQGDSEVFQVELNHNSVARTTGDSRRILTVDEQIAHELGHGTFPFDRTTIFAKNRVEEQAVIHLTDLIRSYLGIPVRGVDGAIRIVRVENLNTIQDPTSFRAH